jgi:hypothetical protein
MRMLAAWHKSTRLLSSKKVLRLEQRWGASGGMEADTTQRASSTRVQSHHGNAEWYVL